MTPNLSLVTAPVNQLVPLVTAKAHLRVTGTADDEYIEGLIDAANDSIEQQINRALINRTYALKFDDVPDTAEVELPHPPAASVTSITYVDTEGSGQTFSSANYLTSLPSGPQAMHGRIRLAESVDWPSVKDQMEAFTITWVAGYGDDPENVPYAIRQAALLIIGHLYENRQDVQVTVPVFEMPMASRWLLNAFRLVKT